MSVSVNFLSTGGDLGGSLGDHWDLLGCPWKLFRRTCGVWAAPLGSREVDRKLTEIELVRNVRFCQLSVNFLSTWGSLEGSW